MASRSLLSLFSLAALACCSLPTHAQNTGNGQAPPSSGSVQADPAAVTIVGTIPDPRVRKLPSPWVLARPEGNVQLDFSRHKVTHRVIVLDPARVKFKGAKTDEVIVTAVGTLAGKVMAVRDLTLHLNPVQMKAHETAMAQQRSEDCRANLRQLEAAKEQWALDGNKAQGAVPTFAELLHNKTYLSRLPVCPGGGNYTLRSTGADPTCSIKGHTLR